MVGDAQNVRRTRSMRVSTTRAFAFAALNGEAMLPAITGAPEAPPGQGGLGFIIRAAAGTPGRSAATACSRTFVPNFAVGSWSRAEKYKQEMTVVYAIRLTSPQLETATFKGVFALQPPLVRQRDSQLLEAKAGDVVSEESFRRHTS